MIRLRGWSAVLCLVLLLVSGCAGDEFGCAKESQWPGRPDCKPVGTTVTLVVDCDPDGQACTQTRYYDEVGESANREMAWRD